MSITLGLNIASLRAQGSLFQTTNSLSTVFERLASGQRINRASDDPAGLALADGLRADQRIYTQAVRNLNDGISLLNIADGALEELTSITTRLSELTEQAANGVLSDDQRMILDAEAQALSDEYFRIVQSTEFNDTQLFTADFGELSLQAGIGANAVISSSLGGEIGTGTFRRTGSFATELPDGGNDGRSTDVVLGDLNGDGLLDMVTAGYAYDSGTGDVQGYATVRLGQGGGSFGAAISLTTEQGTSTGMSSSLTLGDINGDGILDLVTAGLANDGSNQGYATVRLGNGDGTFGGATSIASEQGSTSGRSYEVTLGDVNGDGVLDLVTAGSSNNGPTTYGYATIRLGNGDGTFGTAVSYLSQGISGVTSRTRTVELGDVNGDGILDLVTAGNDGAFGSATIRLGNGDGTFGSALTYTTEEGSGSRSRDVTLGDLNGDGILDLITAGAGDNSGYNGYATVRLGTGDGTFGSSVSYATEQGSTTGGSAAVEVGDFNGDGILDLITAGRAITSGAQGYATVRLGNGDGSFGSAVSYATEQGSSTGRSEGLALGDLNGDGVLDFVTAGLSDSGNEEGAASTFLSLTTDGVAPLLEFSIATVADARQAIPVFQNKLDQLTVQRGEIGAFQSRLNAASRVVQVTAENYAEAESRIRDVDIAQETAELIRLTILQQATAAILSQANLQPEVAIQLIKGNLG